MQRILEAGAGLQAVSRLQAKADQTRRASTHVFVHQRVVSMVRQTGVVDPADLGVRLQMLGNLERVLADAVHAQRQGLNPHQYLEGVHGAQGRAHVAQRHHAGTSNVGGSTQCLGVDHAVVADIGLVQALEARLVLCPGKLARVHNRAANGGAVAAQVLG